MTSARERWRYGKGVVVAALLLLLVESVLHTDAFLLRCRSVFAVGRAMDKLRYVEGHPPALLVLGNSRIDNAFIPAVMAGELSGLGARGAFNLGLPGADARILHGIVLRLDSVGLFGTGRIEHAVIGLDEHLLQRDDRLSYATFLADRATLRSMGLYGDWLQSMIRLWGFSGNLKELREPAIFLRFIHSLREDVEPVGGSASEYRGYRAGFLGQQDAGQVATLDPPPRSPPDEMLVEYLYATIARLRERGVKVAILFPPLLNREVLYLNPADPQSRPYLAIVSRLRRASVPQIAVEPGQPWDPTEFVNPGHLNDTGAKRFSRILATELGKIWPALSEAAR